MSAIRCDRNSDRNRYTTTLLDAYNYGRSVAVSSNQRGWINYDPIHIAGKLESDLLVNAFLIGFRKYALNYVCWLCDQPRTYHQMTAAGCVPCLESGRHDDLIVSFATQVNGGN